MDFKAISTIAVVGLSANMSKPSYGVAAYLQAHGYRIIPVNPKEKEILGERVYTDLASIPQDIRIDVVDIFRRSEQVLPVVEEAIKLKPQVIWMQEGIINEAAKKLGEEAGIEVVMDKCIKKEHMYLN